MHEHTALAILVSQFGINKRKEIALQSDLDFSIVSVSKYLVLKHGLILKWTVLA